VEARDKYNQTPLYFAVHEGAPDVLAALLKAGADVNAKFSQGRTALHDAVKRDKPALVTALLQAGAEVNARDASGARRSFSRRIPGACM